MAQVFFTQERRITVDLNYIRIVVHLEGQGKWDLLVWYFMHFILLPSSAWFGFLVFWMRVGRGVFIAPIAVCHIARARPGIFEILGRHRKEVVKGGGWEWEEIGLREGENLKNLKNLKCRGGLQTKHNEAQNDAVTCAGFPRRQMMPKPKKKRADGVISYLFLKPVLFSQSPVSHGPYFTDHTVKFCRRGGHEGMHAWAERFVLSGPAFSSSAAIWTENPNTITRVRRVPSL